MSDFGPATPTIEEFLEELAISDRKLEYFDGRIVPFAIGSVAHSAVCCRLNALFGAACPKGCFVLTSGAAVRIGSRAYVFPDVSYTCEAIAPTATEIFAPSVVVEVISPYSRRRDRVEKRRAYMQIPGLQEYLLVDSLHPNITLFAHDRARFVPQDFNDLDAIVALRTLDVRFSLGSLYEGLL